MTPLGVKNHNPLNLRPVQPPFEGTVGVVAGPGGDFTVFKDNVFGFRAACRNLIAYYDRENIRTVAQVIARWAPSSENDTRAYITAVCNRTGYRSDQVLELKTYEVAYNLLHAMTVQEQGSFDAYFKGWELTEGLRRAGIADVPATPLHKRITAIGGAVAAGSGVAAAVAPTIQSAVSSMQSVATPEHIAWFGWPLAILTILGGALSIYGSFALARKQGV